MKSNIAFEHDLMRGCCDDMRKLIDARPEGKASLKLRLQQLTDEVEVTYSRLMVDEARRMARLN